MSPDISIRVPVRNQSTARFNLAGDFLVFPGVDRQALVRGSLIALIPPSLK